MYTTATLTHATKMTLLADNGCCTMTFALCTWQPHLMAKITRLGF